MPATGRVKQSRRYLGRMEEDRWMLVRGLRTPDAAMHAKQEGGPASDWPSLGRMT
jgi:hypothetical protein